MNDDPEIAVLSTLVATCQQARRLNASTEVAKVALAWEQRLVSARDKRLAALAALPVAVDPATEGAGREAALAA